MTAGDGINRTRRDGSKRILRLFQRHNGGFRRVPGARSTPGPAGVANLPAMIEHRRDRALAELLSISASLSESPATNPPARDEMATEGRVRAGPSHTKTARIIEGP